MTVDAPPLTRLEQIQADRIASLVAARDWYRAEMIRWRALMLATNVVNIVTWVLVILALLVG